MVTHSEWMSVLPPRGPVSEEQHMLLLHTNGGDSQMMDVSWQKLTHPIFPRWKFFRIILSYGIECCSKFCPRNTNIINLTQNKKNCCSKFFHDKGSNFKQYTNLSYFHTNWTYTCTSHEVACLFMQTFYGRLT